MSRGMCFLCSSVAILPLIAESNDKCSVKCSSVDMFESSNQPSRIEYPNLRIDGLDKVHRDVVINLLVFSANGDVDVDESIKSIYRSGIFSDVSITSLDRGIVVVKIKENPSIERLRFEGNDNIKDEMLKNVINDRMAEGKMFNKSLIYDIISDLQIAYRFNGYPSAVIEPKIIRRGGNKVDVIFEISEGKKALVSKIIFTGNKHYGKDVLKEKIETKERASWRFLNSDVSVFGFEKSKLDREALNDFYKNSGFIDFKVDKIIPELDTKKEHSYLTVMLHEGEQFKISNIEIKSKSKRVAAPSIEQCRLPVIVGDLYSEKSLEIARLNILDLLANKGYVFVDVKTDLHIDREKKCINVSFSIIDTPRVYVERIEIEGNAKTEDSVVRRYLAMHEGDPQSEYDIYRSREALLETGFFADVNIYSERGSFDDRVVLKVVVKESEETSTISLALTAADQDGFGGMIAYSDTNFMGRGQTVSSDVQLAQKMVSGTVSLYEPRFIWDNVAGEIEFGGAKRSRKRQEHSDYKDIHVTPSVMYDINRNLSHRVSCNLMFSRKVWVGNDGHRYNRIPAFHSGKTFLEDEYGNFSSSELSSTLTYKDKFKTKQGVSGYSVSLRNAYSGIASNTKYFRNSISAEYFSPCHAIDNKTTFVLNGCLSIMHDIKNVRGFFRHQPGADGQSFRGFDTVSPRESFTGDCIGGLKMWNMSAQLRRPISGQDLGVFGSLFVDIGSVWGVPHKYKNKTLSWDETVNGANVKCVNKINDSACPRISLGFAIEWKKCPLGTPISFIFAAPVKKCRHDVRRAFTLGM